MSSEQLWDTEYFRGTIPGSTRRSPSHVLLLFQHLLPIAKINKVLDAGCGNGRNSIYLAELGPTVVGLDSSVVAIEKARSFAKERKLEERVSFQKADLMDPLPFKSESFDLCLDMYLFCHFIESATKRRYVNELYRVTNCNGHVLTAQFSRNDEYYQRFVVAQSEPTIVEDPVNQIAKQLYTKEELKAAFTPPFIPRYFVEFEFQDVVREKQYRRNILATLLQKVEGPPSQHQ